MQTNHISFPTTDRLTLPGLLYAPTTPTKAAVVWLHGMGDSGVFYSPKRITALAESLTKRDIALLAFNNRGAHNSKLLYRDDPNLKRSEQRYQAGTHNELIADCVYDIDGAALFLQELGYNQLHLAGHSTGANKVAIYDRLQPINPFLKYVLAGPGDDVGLRYQELGTTKFWRSLDYARAALAKGQPYKIMPLYSGLHPFSAQSAADILDPDGDYNVFSYYEAVHGALGSKPPLWQVSAITRPMLVIAGQYDEATASAGGAKQALEIIHNHTHSTAKSQSDFQIVADSDHSFHDAEADFSERVAAWLNS